MVENTVIITGIIIGGALITCAAICGFSMAGKLSERGLL